MYTIRYGKNRIDWHNGAILRYMPRVITGSKAHSRSKPRGKPTSFVIDDETAIGFDMEWYQNAFARVREAATTRYFLTLTTPLVGPYGRFLKRGGNKIFTGRTRDNHYLLYRDPTYESRQRAIMSKDQARRELDGELVALEGRLWKEFKADVAWPKGNRNDQHVGFDSEKPWWLFCDLGSATGAYVVVQQTEPTYRGRNVFNDGGPLWVAVADYCPNDDASASRAFQMLKSKYGFPAGVVAGRDHVARDKYEGRTLAYFTRNVLGGARIYTSPEDNANKMIQYDCLSSLICAGNGERRFTVARDFVSHDPDSRRGLLEMFDEDQMPPADERSPNDFLPKHKGCMVQHVGDAVLMGCHEIIKQPSWDYDKNPMR